MGRALIDMDSGSVASNLVLKDTQGEIPTNSCFARRVNELPTSLLLLVWVREARFEPGFLASVEERLSGDHGVKVFKGVSISLLPYRDMNVRPVVPFCVVSTLVNRRHSADCKFPATGFGSI